MHKDEEYFDSNELIDEVLKNEPRFSLPDNFADKVVDSVSSRFAWMQYIKEFLIYLGTFIGIGLASLGIGFVLVNADLNVWLSVLTANLGIITGVSIIAIFVLFTDRVLLRYFMFKSRPEMV